MASVPPPKLRPASASALADEDDRPGRAKTVARPRIPEAPGSAVETCGTEHRRQTATRYPRLYRGEQAAANLVVEVLRRRGTSQLELAEDLNVSPTIVSDWCHNRKPFRLGAILALQNKRLARDLLNEALDYLDNRSQEHR